MGGVTYAGYWYGTRSSNLKPQISKPQLKTQIPETPTPKPTVEDETKNWKTYTSSKYGFTFDYPQDYQVEERVDGFFVITAPGEQVPQGGISIDARLQGIYETYDKAVGWITSSLDVSQNTRVNDWNTFVGVGRENMIKGIEFKQAVAHYKTGALDIETINNEPYKSLFNKILSTFKFLD